MPQTIKSHDVLSLLACPGVMELLFSAEPGEERKEPEPKRSPNPHYTEDDYALYCTARKVADIVFEEWVKCGGTVNGHYPQPWLGDRRSDSVNPFYSQTATGLRVEWSYTHPHSLHTPWGEWHLTSGASYSGDIMERFSAAVLTRFQVTTFVPFYIASGPLGGPMGPVYDLVAVDGELLPPATSHSSGKFWRSYEDANAQWATMAARYDSEHANRR